MESRNITGFITERWAAEDSVKRPGISLEARDRSHGVSHSSSNLRSRANDNSVSVKRSLPNPRVKGNTRRQGRRSAVSRTCSSTRDVSFYSPPSSFFRDGTRRRTNPREFRVSVSRARSVDDRPALLRPNADRVSKGHAELLHVPTGANRRKSGVADY